MWVPSLLVSRSLRPGGVAVEKQGSRLPDNEVFAGRIIAASIADAVWFPHPERDKERRPDLRVLVKGIPHADVEVVRDIGEQWGRPSGWSPGWLEELTVPGNGSDPLVTPVAHSQESESSGAEKLHTPSDIALDVEAIPEWIERLLDSDKYADVANKFVHSGELNHWAFVFATSQPTRQEDYHIAGLLHDLETLPETEPHLPGSLDRVWVSNSVNALYFDRLEGWRRASVPVS